ncbi:Histone H4 transcription factor [Quillaja saponaria]|uniref:Histone H4 transcription factor n=1 Tax=Quillaja saponaria TaxID=32244 RepID=A0AAD7VII1_QUISA|nr:Histone H4 transcription factor [Quillaja saponaria]
MGLCFGCFGGDNNHMTKEEQRLASEEARARAAEAAQKRQEEYENSAAGRAARAQIQGMQKQSANSNKGESALKVFFKIPFSSLEINYHDFYPLDCHHKIYWASSHFTKNFDHLLKMFCCPLFGKKFCCPLVLCFLALSFLTFNF